MNTDIKFSLITFLQHACLVAHPGEISDITVSADGKYLFSSGGSDMTVMMWRIQCNSEEAALDLIDDYLSLLEGGKNGPLHNEIIDYFYSAQLRAQVCCDYFV